MNNNDLIRREDVFRELDSFLAEAVEYERISRRFSDWCASTLCSECSFYDDCPQSSPEVIRELTPEQRVAAMQRWAAEHPEEVGE